MARRPGKVNTNDYDRIEPQNSEQAQREVERTRSRMSDTLEALEQKIEPRRLLDQISTTIKSSDIQGYVSDMVSRNHIPLMLIGAGATWMVVDTLRRRSGTVSEDTSPSAVAGIGQRVSSVAGQVGDSLSGTARSLGGKAAGVLDAARQRTSDLAGTVRKSVTGMTEQVRSVTRQHMPEKGFWEIFDKHPLAVTAGVFAAGVLAGMAIPLSRREEEVMGEAAGRLVSNAKETGRRAIQQTAAVVTRKVSNVARSAADAATERLHSDEPLLDKVKGMAQDAAQTAREQMRKEGLLTDDSEEYGSISPDRRDSSSHRQADEPLGRADPATVSTPPIGRPSEALDQPGAAPPPSIPGGVGGQTGDRTAGPPEAGLTGEDRSKQDKHHKS
jgi:hypothetical protein